jgi:AraC-like DNA-binding protein
VIEKGEGVIIPHGHSIIAERSFNDRSYSSLVVFFPAQIANTILKKYRQEPVEPAAGPVVPHLLKFRLDAFLSEFVNQLLTFIDKQIPLPEVLINHRIEELLIALLELDPHGLPLLFDQGLHETNDLRTLIENNLLKGLSLDELAFLANRSLASFKRDFEKVYHTSPGKYLLERKLEVASHALREGKRAAELFLEFGYENLSNFNTAFKRKFNQTPKAYQEAFAN